MANEPKKIGLMVGREWSWPPKFIEEVNRRDAGVIAEFVQIGGTRMNEPTGYAVIVDRISHEVPYYRTYLKNAVLQGTKVINNPFMWSADDKFFEAGLATRLGVASPKTVVLPNKEYIEGIVSESLRNLTYPIDWEGIAAYVGMPAILKDAHGGGWKEVYKVNSVDELIWRYNESGRLTMIVQEFIEWDHYVRCLCINQEWILPMKYDPRERRYHVEHEHMSPELGARVMRDAQVLCQALGYDMNTVEFAVRDGVPYAIDFMNPAPDMDIYSLTPHYFQWAVDKMADMCIQKALSDDDARREYRWFCYLPEGQGPAQGSGASGGQSEASQAAAPTAETTAAPEARPADLESQTSAGETGDTGGGLSLSAPEAPTDASAGETGDTGGGLSLGASEPLSDAGAGEAGDATSELSLGASEPLSDAGAGEAGDTGGGLSLGASEPLSDAGAGEAGDATSELSQGAPPAFTGETGDTGGESSQTASEAGSEASATPKRGGRSRKSATATTEGLTADASAEGSADASAEATTEGTTDGKATRKRSTKKS